MFVQRTYAYVCASIAFVALLVVAACGSASTGVGSPPTKTPSPTPTVPSGPVVTVPITSVTMITTTVGWGAVQPNSGSDNQPIAYTVDSGRTWYNVSPADFTPSQHGFFGIYAMSSTEAWTWADNTLWHTADAGAHWTKSLVPKAAFGPVKNLDFINSTTGWMATTGEGAAGTISMDIWQTTDGGATWTHTTGYPGLGGHNIGIGFANATTGFATSFDEASSGMLISVTHDAGYSWSGVSLPVPGDLYQGGCCSTVEPPVFTSVTNGVLEVLYPTNPDPKLVLYHTTDAGTTWTLGPSISIAGFPIGQGGSPPVSVTANGEVFAAITAASGSVALYDLPFAASSWTQIQTTTPLLAGLTQLDFVDALHGWAVAKAGLIGSSDGGVTWTVLHAPPSGPFQVTSVSVTVDPTTIAGMKCGTYLFVGYTVTFGLAPNGAGGTTKFWYTINNGRGQNAGSVTVAPGQIVATYLFWWEDNLPADHSYPEPGGVQVTSPNSVQSNLVGPSGQCQ